MLSAYGKREWTTILVMGLMLSATSWFVGWLWLVPLWLVATLALLSFFRDPNRFTPSERGVVVSPADGRISSIHRVEHFEPFSGPATCIRIFLSVFNVHVNRCPCHGLVKSVSHRPGKHLNALNPTSAEVNESTLMILVHPIRQHPVAAVRQVAGLIARTIVCVAKPAQILQRGQRVGMIKFGSTTELYLPDSERAQVAVHQGQRVHGGVTVLARVHPQNHSAASGDGHGDQSPTEAEASCHVEAGGSPP